MKQPQPRQPKPKARTSPPTTKKQKRPTSKPAIETPEQIARGIKEGYRSGLEDQIATQLELQGIEVNYETMKIKYLQPAKLRTYTPDFILPNGIIIESKGRFVTADRQKHLLVQEQHPELDIRFVFSNPNTRINKNSPTTYGMWCEKNGFKYAAKVIPQAWIDEPKRGKPSDAKGKDTEALAS